MVGVVVGEPRLPWTSIIPGGPPLGLISDIGDDT